MVGSTWVHQQHSGVDNSDMLILDLASDNSPEWNKTGSVALH